MLGCKNQKAIISGSEKLKPTTVSGLGLIPRIHPVRPSSSTFSEHFHATGHRLPLLVSLRVDSAL